MSSLLGTSGTTGTESSFIHEHPLYSKEEIDEVHKKRTLLEMEVQTLEQQLKARKEQVKQSKEKLVSRGELSMVKAETRESISESNSSQLNQILDSFQNVIKETCSLSVQNYIINQQIQDEEMQRLNRIDEYDIIDNAFDFSELRAKMPQIKSLSKEPQKLEQMDFDRYTQSLKSTQKAFTELSVDSGPTPKQIEAANELARSTEPRIKLKKIGTSFERAENQRLELLLKQSEAELKAMENANEGIKRKISSIDMETNNIGVAGNAQAAANETAFKNSMKSLDNDIQNIKNKIDDSADRYDKLCEQIAKMKVVEVEVEPEDSLDIFDDHSEEEEVTNFDFNDEYSQQELMEDELRNRAELLKQEIAEMRSKYNETRRLAIEREQTRTKEIKAIYAKYQKNKLVIQEELSQLSMQLSNRSSPNSSQSSGISASLRNALEQIESSIVEAQSIIG